jgi:hypothetical protein
VLALPDEAYVAGFASVRHFANNTWTGEATSAGTTFRAFHAVSSTDIWAAGQNDVGHSNGSAWTVESPGGAGASLFGISGIGSSFWIVGSDSLILHRR